MSELKILTSASEIDYKKWDEFVFNHPNGNFFQTPNAFRFFEGLLGYKPILIAALENDSIKGILLALLMKGIGIKGYFSARCIVWGAPICYDINTSKLLVKKLNEFCKNEAIYIEFRNLYDTSEYTNSFENENYIFNEWLNYKIWIDDFDVTFGKVKYEKRRQFKKALKEGVTFNKIENEEELKQLYKILKFVYKTTAKKPLPDFKFFEEFYKKNIGICFAVKSPTNQIIGGSVCPIYNKIIYDWYRCGLDKEFKSFYPSTIAVFAELKYASVNGFKEFDFMGAGSPDADYGVREFKSQFGGELVRYGRYLYVNKKLLYNLGKLAVKMHLR